MSGSPGDFASSVRAWTTRPEFLGPLVGRLPRSRRVPSPAEFFGYHIGAPDRLTRHDDIVGYLRTLAARTGRVRIEPAGRSDEGRAIPSVFIGSASYLRDLDRHRATLSRLADPRSCTVTEAARIIRHTRPHYHFIAGVHGSEPGPPEMLLELAFRLAVDPSPAVARIRRRLVVGMTPVVEPDGRERYIDWHRRHGGELARRCGPPITGRYVAHDSNRDLCVTQAATRALLRWYLKWHPIVVHDLHESEPLLHTFDGQPVGNSHLDPSAYRDLEWFAARELSTLRAFGMPGTRRADVVDTWWPGYPGFAALLHNGLFRLYEGFGHGGPETLTRRLDPEVMGETEIVWSIRNSINYLETAALVALGLAASRPRTLLHQFYRRGCRALARRIGEATAYIVAGHSPNPAGVAWLIDILLRHGIEVDRTSAPVVLDGQRWPEGSYVVRCDQPYGPLVKTLLERQAPPADAPTLRGDSGWSLGLAANVPVHESRAAGIGEIAVQRVRRSSRRGRWIGDADDGGTCVVAHRGSPDIIRLRYALAGADVSALEIPCLVEGVRLPPGSLVVRPSGARLARRLRRLVLRLGLDAVNVDADVALPASAPIQIPRLAVLSSWGGAESCGWARYSLDRFGVAYELIYKERVREGSLRDEFDVVLVPSVAGGGRGLIEDLPSSLGPLGYSRSPRFPTLGRHGSSRDITGGLGNAGVDALRTFVAGGGLLVTLGLASFLPADQGFVEDVSAARMPDACEAQGPILQGEIVGGDHPLFHGYSGPRLPVRLPRGPLLSVTGRDAVPLLRFAPEPELVLSGRLRGADHIAGRPAIVDAASGRGRVLLFATNPFHRAQPFGELTLVFNAIVYAGQIVEGRAMRALPSRECPEDNPAHQLQHDEHVVACG